MRYGGEKGRRLGRCGGGDFAELALVPDDDRRNDRRQRRVSSGTLLQEHTTTSRLLLVVTENLSVSPPDIRLRGAQNFIALSMPEYLTPLLLLSKIPNITPAPFSSCNLVSK